jgi:aminoglycoside 6'-N-acetyltransferase
MRTTLYGAMVTLRPATAADIPVLVEIRATPEVYQRWRGGEDLASEVADDANDPDTHPLVIEHGDRQRRCDPVLQQGRLPPGRHHAPVRARA